MDEREKLVAKKHELEQLIRSRQDSITLPSSQWSDALSLYTPHPADMASNLQVLNIELERINDALAQYHPEQLG